MTRRQAHTFVTQTDERCKLASVAIFCNGPNVRNEQPAHPRTRIIANTGEPLHQQHQLPRVEAWQHLSRLLRQSLQHQQECTAWLRCDGKLLEQHKKQLDPSSAGRARRTFARMGNLLRASTCGSWPCALQSTPRTAQAATAPPAPGQPLRRPQPGS